MIRFYFILLILSSLACSSDSSQPEKTVKNNLTPKTKTILKKKETTFQLNKTLECGNDLALGCFNAALKYASVDEENNQHEKMNALFQIACHHDHFESCYILGNKYSVGKEVIKDTEKAIELWTKACDGKLGKACFLIGNYFLKEKNSKKANNFFKKACTYQDQLGCQKLENK